MKKLQISQSQLALCFKIDMKIWFCCTCRFISSELYFTLFFVDLQCRVLGLVWVFSSSYKIHIMYLFFRGNVTDIFHMLIFLSSHIHYIHKQTCLCINMFMHSYMDGRNASSRAIHKGASINMTNLHPSYSLYSSTCIWIFLGHWCSGPNDEKNPWM